MISEGLLRVSHYYRFGPTVYLIFFLIFVSGCAGLQKPPSSETPSPEIPSEVRTIIENIRQTNHKLMQLKGLGSYRLVSDQGRLSGRMGWACRLPDQFRADILDFSGRLAATITGNGHRLQARIKGDQKIYTRSNATRVIEKIIGSPVKLSDIIAFLSGRVPLRDYYGATIQDLGQNSALNSANDQKILILKNRSGNIVEKIVLEANRLEPMRVVMYNKVNKLAYEAILGVQNRKGRFTFFSTVSFRAENGNHFDLTVSRLWLDMDLPDSIFTLAPPF